MVYNAFNYPHLMSFFNELGVQGEDTTMGFSVSADDGAFEYAAGETLSKLFATRKNLLNPFFYFMILEILRFNRLAQAFLHLPETHPDRSLTTEAFLKKNRFSSSFANRYLVPMTAAIWSSTSKGIMNFPAITLFTFLNKYVAREVI
jgi:cyclopropane-fatty-acyl-phospholipid synthase